MQECPSETLELQKAFILSLTVLILNNLSLAETERNGPGKKDCFLRIKVRFPPGVPRGAGVRTVKSYGFTAYL
jgi:hypothetical protein